MTGIIYSDGQKSPPLPHMIEVKTLVCEISLVTARIC